MQADPITQPLPVTSGIAALAQAGPGTPYLGLPIALGGVAAAAATTLVAGLWGGSVPFWGPEFGFGRAGAPAWQWGLGNGALNAVPAGVAVLCALAMVVALWRVRLGGGRALLAVAGAVAALAGAWMVVGPWALPLMSDVGLGDLASGGLGAFARIAGYHLGPGVVLVASGSAAAVVGNQHKTVRFVVVRPR